MKKVMLVFGTRPEAIKMCPLVKEFQKHSDAFETIVCVTGQHREMLDQVLRIFEVVPDYDLNIMKQGQDLYDVTARVLVGMRDVLKEVQPDVVLVHGDTTTSMAAAMAAFYQQIPVGHVEAGLRTHNMLSPWPEEMNRQVTGRIADYNFSPTPLSRQNLLDEKAAGQIFVTGNTVIDALHWVVNKLKDDPTLAAEQEEVLRKAGYSPTSFLPQGEDDGQSSVPANGEGAHYMTADPSLYSLLKGFAEENKRNSTDAELVLWKLLRNHGVGAHFRRQHIIGTYIADFVCLEKHLVVEVDGGYHSEEKQIQYDEDRTSWLKAKGYQVLRFSNDQVIGAPDDVLKQISTALDSSPLGGGKEGASPTTEVARRMVLITGHRRENFGEGFIQMLTAIKDLTIKYPDVDFVYPMHLNPNVRNAVREVFGPTITGVAKVEGTVPPPWGEQEGAGPTSFLPQGEDDGSGSVVTKVGGIVPPPLGEQEGAPNLYLIEPLQYLEFVYLMEKSTIVLTDSGGIQEEAPGLGKPVLVMRNTTERPEALDAGTVKLVGTDHDLIVSEVSRLLDDPEYYNCMSQAVNPYGDGHACERIVEALR